ncbi:MAG TPA: peptidase M50, partial [Planctomycetaceae bacterium]|nr:peptidase M50 [Planctomycetaceae bacterium]
MLLGRIAGIDLKIHWSFWALVGFYLISTSMAAGLAQGAFSVVLIGSVFACVVAHEYGH